MEGTATPRITCAYLNSYVGKHVIVVGKVIQLRGEEAIVDADGNITAHLNRVSFPPLSLGQKHLDNERGASHLTPRMLNERVLGNEKLTRGHRLHRKRTSRQETACRSLAR